MLGSWLRVTIPQLALGRFSFHGKAASTGVRPFFGGGGTTKNVIVLPLNILSLPVSLNTATPDPLMMSLLDFRRV